jgi:hypothetical protein
MIRIDGLTTNGKRHMRAVPSAVFEPIVVSDNQRAEVTRVSIPSVARVAVPFCSIAGVTAISALLVFWLLLRGTGTVGRFEHFIDDATGLKHFHLMSVPVLVGCMLFITLLVIIAIALTIAGAMVYNLLAMSTGGVEVRYRASTRPAPALRHDHPRT